MKNKTLSVVFDDVCYHIDAEDTVIRCLHYHEYSECVEIALTQKQYEDYISRDKREFNISQKSIDAVNKYINDTKNNVWRRQNN